MTVVQLGAMCLVGLDTAGMAGAASLAARVTEWGVAGLGVRQRVPGGLRAVAHLACAHLVRVGGGRAPRGARHVVDHVEGIVDTLRRRWAVRTSGVMAAGLLLWIATDPPTLARSHGDGRLHVTTIDVGQGDCVLVTFPNGRRLLVDAGGVTVRGDFDIGDRIVGPALRARGLRRLDYLAITHGDPDHIGGARAVLRDFTPLEIWQGVPVPEPRANRGAEERR